MPSGIEVQRSAANFVSSALDGRSVTQRLGLRISASGLGKEKADSQPGSIGEDVSLFTESASPFRVRST
jgi:hypothetical protein